MLPLAILIAQQLTLIALLALLIQFVVALFAWRYRHENVVYRLMGVVTAPAVWLAGRLLPPSRRSRYAAAAAFALAACLYLALGLWHRDVCLRDLSQPACTKWAIARGLKQP
jgi:hypothetical protein